MFWTPNGPSANLAELTYASAPETGMVQLRIWLQEAATECVDEPKVAREDRSDDMETLREIARRIRSGSKTEARLVDASEPQQGPPALDFRPAKAPPEVSSRVPLQPTDSRFRDNLAKLVHELRTPLSAIASLAEIMRDERLGPMGNDRYKSYAADIFDSAQHTLDLVAATLESAGDTADTKENSADSPQLQPTNFTAVDVDEIARSCVSCMQPIATRAGVNLEFFPANVPILQADRRAVRQMILNIVSNALRYTPTNGNISVKTDRGRNGAVILEVSDTGSGMRSADLVRALSPPDPRPVDTMPPRIRIAGGHHGIGLPLVRSLIESHGGQFAIESKPGEGTRVTLTFPAERVGS